MHVNYLWMMVDKLNILILQVAEKFCFHKFTALIIVRLIYKYIIIIVLWQILTQLNQIWKQPDF